MAVFAQPATAQGGSGRAPDSTAQAAQVEPAQPPARSQYDEPNAQETRDRLRSLLAQHPSTVQEIFKLDPALLNDANYMAPYPALAAFVRAHPEIVRNPRYFLGLPGAFYAEQSGPRSASVGVLSDMFTALLVFTGFLTVAGVVTWVIKTAVDYRRWLRLSKVQTEAHTKVVDRLTSSDELLGYVQSPAGRRFLEAGPAPIEPGRSVAAPFGRILWSLQAGTVVTLVGAALLFVSRRLASDPDLVDATPFMFLMGTIAFAIGVGFVLSSFMSYLVSRRLGLLDTPAPPHA